MSTEDAILANFKDVPDDIDEKVAAIIQDYHAITDSDAKKEAAFDVVNKLSFLTFSFPIILDHNSHLYRGRTVESNNQLYGHIDKLTYNHDPEKIELNRANTTGQQILYSCFDKTTVYSELGCMTDSAVNILTFKPKEKEILQLIPVGQIDSVRRYGRVTVGNNSYTAHLQKHLDLLSDSAQMAVFLADAFFADEFSKPDPKYTMKEGDEISLSPYAITSLIAHELRSNARIDGIIYPSVQYSGGFNVALNADSFDSKCEPVKFEAFQVLSHFGYGMNKVFEYASGDTINSDGRPLWQWPVLKYQNAKVFI